MTDYLNRRMAPFGDEIWKRIDEAAVDVEVAWEARAEAEQAVEAAEVAAATAVERLLNERLTIGDVVKLTGLDQATVRRLRQPKTAVEKASGAPMRPIAKG